MHVHARRGEGEGEGEEEEEEEEKTFAQSDEKAIAPAPAQEAVFDLPLVDKSEFGVPQSLYAEFVKAYPGVDVMSELAKMRLWLISNPRNKKTRSGIRRFMNTWLTRAQDGAIRKPEGAPARRYANDPAVQGSVMR